MAFLLVGLTLAFGIGCGRLLGQVAETAGPATATRNLPEAPLNASISGTVTDEQGDVISGATVTLRGPQGRRTITTGEQGGFAFNELRPGGPYRLTVECKDCLTWGSDDITLKPGQFLEEDNIHLQLSGGTVSVVVKPKTELQLATEQVHAEEHQRVLGVIPNFYVSYDPQAAPLSWGLKYKLALRTALDPVTVAGALFIAGIDQAGGTPNYGGGVEGYAKRVGSEYASGFTDVMAGGAVLPALLHQDPRYFYKGTGTRRARLMHAIGSAVLCRGDNGRTQINYSSMGGDLISGALSNLYLPQEDRGVGATFEGFGIATAGHVTVDILQEFFLNRLTKRGRTK
ncbi:MAG: carboxypeptidase-like regulatory domain-containing protein [Acidobacteriaceae bacterium]